ncbi:MAG: preprotein translocase subunit SecE [Deltaproteobacteria bacterium]|nr:MAG: preprotein translocase subunit SecE [Deltaproteobacteria bacterium]
MKQITRYVTVSYLVLALVVAWVMVRIFAGVLDAMGPGSDPILFAGIRLSVFLGSALTAGVTVYCWKSEKIFRGANEVVIELSKTTWPDWPDTRKSTWVVIVFSVIVALFLAFFDFIWKMMTDTILSA